MFDNGSSGPLRLFRLLSWQLTRTLVAQGKHARTIAEKLAAQAVKGVPAGKTDVGMMTKLAFWIIDKKRARRPLEMLTHEIAYQIVHNRAKDSRLRNGYFLPTTATDIRTARALAEIVLKSSGQFSPSKHGDPRYSIMIIDKPDR